jgi:hypothetical protein
MAMTNLTNDKPIAILMAFSIVLITLNIAYSAVRLAYPELLEEKAVVTIKASASSE